MGTEMERVRSGEGGPWMKKLLSVLLAAAFLLLFTACATEPAGPSQMQLAPGNLTDEE